MVKKNRLEQIAQILGIDLSLENNIPGDSTQSGAR